MLQVKILHRWCQGYMIHVLEFIPWGKHYLQIKGKYFFSIFLIISTISNINCLSRINSCKQSLSTNTVIVGGATLLYIDSTVVQLANECVNNLTSDNTMAFDIESRVRVVYQVEISGQLYSSSQYNRTKRRNTYTVLYTNKNGINAVGLIQYYMCAADKLVLAVIEILEQLPVSRQEHFQLTSAAIDSFSCLAILPVRPSGCLDVVELSRIKEKCIYIELPAFVQYVSCIPPCFHD